MTPHDWTKDLVVNLGTRKRPELHLVRSSEGPPPASPWTVCGRRMAIYNPTELLGYRGRNSVCIKCRVRRLEDM